MELFHLCVLYVYQQGFKKRVVIHVQPLAQLVHNHKAQWGGIHGALWLCTNYVKIVFLAFSLKKNIPCDTLVHVHVRAITTISEYSLLVF
jgi:hypothetical protein